MLSRQQTILLIWDLRGGVGGGTIIATGTPEEVAANEVSYTGHYLKGKLHHE